MSAVLVVGQAPAKASAPDFRALDPRSASGRRLAAYAGLDPWEMHRRADFVNLVPWFPGRQAGDKYDVLDRAVARDMARHMAVTIFREYGRVVLLGRAVSDAFTSVTDLPRLDWFEPHRLAGSTVYASPHPAGTSMFWNDPLARAAGGAFWRSVLAAPEKEK